ncbi:hypothetical protein [Paenibacillus tepidiphilus]|uniref:hypothetical protein n=1 Tax=Paenibacillus tepidiphilus TaxID=2608683 RepID=UPI00123A8AE2|nr:hypothetical protein [Paenibacillus tepidiphilus]
MKIFANGLDAFTVNELKAAGFTVVVQNVMPEQSQVQENLLITTSDIVKTQELEGLRQDYPDAIILYLYMDKGVRNYQIVHIKCQTLGINFMPPRTTATIIVDKIRLILKDDLAFSDNLIACLGSGNGIGCTSVAKAIAKRIAADGKKVIVLGLNLYDPGYDFKPEVSLDLLRPRMTGRILKDEDFNNFIKQDGYLYLPGNFDYLSAQDYQEEEIEYLLSRAKENADVVIADIGAIPESAAWYVTMQKAPIHILITHPRHFYRLEQLLDLASHLDFQPHDFLAIINRSTSDNLMTSKSLSSRLGVEVFMELPIYNAGLALDQLPLDRKETHIMDEKIRQMLATMNLEYSQKKKGLFS